MFKLSIITPEQLEFEDEVISVIAPGAMGYFQILSHHAAIISLLQPGKVVVKDKNNQEILWAVSYGFLEMSQNECVLLADTAELASDIDPRRAQDAYNRARIILDGKPEGADLLRAQKALKRAEARIKVYQEYKPSQFFSTSDS